jgi:hypothetical protein
MQRMARERFQPYIFNMDILRKETKTRGAGPARSGPPRRLALLGERFRTFAPVGGLQPCCKCRISGLIAQAVRQSDLVQSPQDRLLGGTDGGG